MLDNLGRYVRHLRDIARTEREAFLKDAAKIGGAKYYLQSSIAVCLDIGNHIIASDGYRAPKDYRDIFSVLNENGLIPGGSRIRSGRWPGFATGWCISTGK